MKNTIIILLILTASIYPFSFAKYNWKNKNKKAAVGVILLAFISIFMPLVIIFTKK